jgi:hypothetical protein
MELIGKWDQKNTIPMMDRGRRDTIYGGESQWDGGKA